MFDTRRSVQDRASVGGRGAEDDLSPTLLGFEGRRDSVWDDAREETTFLCAVLISETRHSGGANY